MVVVGQPKTTIMEMALSSTLLYRWPELIGDASVGAGESRTFPPRQRQRRYYGPRPTI